MNGKNAFRNWLLLTAATVSAVALCVFYVDRPVAEFSDKYVRHTEAWVWLARALAPLDLVVVAALLLLFVLGARVLFGDSLPPRAQVWLLCSWAAMWATAADIILKRIFGRGLPDPTYTQNHLYGFRLLHGGLYWQSFPSGTAAISAAIVSVLWILTPRWRALGVSMVVLLSFAVVVNNYHWVGDVVAGAYLGASIGWMTVGLHASSRQLT